MTGRLQGLINLEREFFKPYANKICEGGISNEEYEDIEMLLELAKRPQMKIADVGCYSGFSTVLFGTFAKENQGLVYAIDNFQGSPDAKMLIDDHRNNNVRAILDLNLRTIGVSNYVNIIAKPSLEAVRDLENNYFDFIFIDADHRYEEVKADILAWMPKLKVGGTMAGHDCEIILREGLKSIKDGYGQKDYHGFHFGVIFAVSETLPAARLVDRSNNQRREPTRIWFIQK